MPFIRFNPKNVGDLVLISSLFIDYLASFSARQHADQSQLWLLHPAVKFILRMFIRWIGESLNRQAAALKVTSTLELFPCPMSYENIGI